ncbi:MAG TPA: 4-vinyl reductase [Candidatus Thermoplasmatota archaeon]|nr:4-vinyl reductase [Candidatus Thermoplasmatota archaeon]
MLDLLDKFAAPTGERGSILLMSGGLIVLGFLFLAFLFRSAIVGDLAPVANARLPTPRAMLPPVAAHVVAPRAIPRDAFEQGRETGRKASPIVDKAFDHLRAHGLDARILQSNMHWKHVRVYACASCAAGASARGCEFERGLLAGAFEAMTGDLAKVHETACVARGDAHCEYEVRHAPLLEVA